MKRPMSNWWRTFRAQKLEELAGILGVAVADLPAVFQSEHPKALKIGIHHDLIVRYPDADRKALSQWLGRWTFPFQYLNRIVSGTHRHDLDGNDAAPITDGDRADAQRRIDAGKARLESRRRRGSVAA